MNIIYKYKTVLTLVDVVATADANVATGINAGGGYEGAIAGFTAIGVKTAMAAGMGVGVIPTTVASFDGTMETSRVYDVLLNNAAAIGGQPHIYKLPLTILGVDPVNQKINAIEFLNTFNPATGDIFPVTDRFFYKYNFATKAIFFGFPDADVAAYNGLGLKLQITLVSTKL
jgi:hypothetical protein